MKVYYIGNTYMGCYYVRCYLPMMHNGWKGTHYGLAKNKIKDPRLVTQEILDSDVVVFHRANTNWHHRVGMMAKEAGKKIVFDNDDTYKLDDTHPFFGLDEKGFEENKERVNNVTNNFILNSDLITCSTEYLAKEYRELNKNVVVLPNYVDPDDWDEPLRNEGDKVRIGIVGSVAYHHDFAEIKDVIKKLHDNPKIQLVLFGLWKGVKRDENKLVDAVLHKEYDFWDSLPNIEHMAWCEMSDYFDTLNELKLDLMLIPRRENGFNKAKSNIKFLEAGMLEIPVVASSFPDAPYEKDIDGTNGVLVKKGEDWEEKVMDLVNNKEKRREMGKKAREYIIKNYNIADHYQEWETAYQKLYEKN